MLRGLYTATSAMDTSQRKLDVIANNIANVNSTGFKKDVVISESFPEVLLAKINGSFPARPFTQPRQIEVQRDGEGYILSTTAGYFTVDSPTGKGYSKDARFAVDEEGYLKTYHRDMRGEIRTTQGNYLLDRNGQRVLVGEDFEIQDIIQNLIYMPAHNIIGTINAGLRIDLIETNFRQGTLEETGNSLSFALHGRGFFQVQLPAEEEQLDGENIIFTRNGHFTLNNEGQIVSTEGYPLLGQNGPITLDNQDFYVSKNGEIIVNNEIVDQIQIIDINNVQDLRKFKEGYYGLADGIELDIIEFEGEVLQGYLEGSNVNAIEEMVEMINALRVYESNSKVVKAYDEILQRAVNDIGKI